jgi:tetratricopeptide (TPR) repeat protein
VSSDCNSNAQELFDRLAQGLRVDEDVRALRIAAISSGEEGKIQFGKFIVNVGSGRDIQIGDRVVVGSTAEAIRHEIESVHSQIKNNLFDLSLREYFRALRQYSREFPYLSVDFPLGKTLTDVYVPLDLISDFSNLAVGQIESRGHDIRFAFQHTSSGPTRSTLLLGPPGAGKSTLLRQILEHAWDRPTEIGLNEPHIPILVRFQFLMRATGGLEERLWGACKESNEYVLASPPPPNWFTEWPKITGFRWLLLLDGLDEVTPEQMKDFETWLRKVQESGYTSVVASRNIPSITGSEFLRTFFDWYRIGPLTTEQQERLVRNWVGDRAASFFSDFKRLKTGSLSETPLLLTIAAVVFQSDKQLPSRRSLLYNRFVDVSLKEAVRRGLENDLGESSLYIWEALTQVALSMSVNWGSPTTSYLKRDLARFFVDELQRPPLEATKWAQRFLEAMAHRSGLFTMSPQGTISWLHATFHEFLTAEAISNMDDPWPFISRWREDHWRSVTSFLFNKWSDRDVVSSFALRILADSQLVASLFVAELIAEGACVTDNVAQTIARSVCATIVLELKTERERINNPIGFQELVLGSQESVRLLAAVRRLYDLGPSIRDLAETLCRMCRDSDEPQAEIQALEQLNCKEELRELLCSCSARSEVGICALMALVRLKDWDSIAPCMVETLDTIPNDQLKHLLDEFSASERRDLLLNCVTAKTIAPPIRSYAAKLFLIHASLDETRRLARDPTLPNEVRLPATIALRRTAKSQECKVPLFSEWDLSGDRTREESISLLVASLVNLGEWEELVALALGDETAYAFRGDILDPLADARKVDELRQLATGGRPQMRLDAALKLYELEDNSESAACVLDACQEILGANAADHGTRLKKGDCLRNLGRYEEAIVEYSRILESEPNEVALCNRALSYEYLDKLPEAHADFTLSLVRNADDWTYLHRAKVAWNMRDYEAAIADFERAIRLKTSATWFYRYLGDSYAETLAFSKGLRWLCKAVESTADATNFAYRGKAYLNWGKLEQSMDDLTRAISLARTNSFVAWIRRIRAQCSRQLGRYDMALADLRLALSVGGSKAGLSLVISMCLRLKMNVEAAKYLDMVTSTDDDPWWDYLRALSLKVNESPNWDVLLRRAIERTQNSMPQRKDLDRLESNVAVYSLVLGDQKSTRNIYERLLQEPRGRFRIRRFAIEEIDDIACLFPADAGVRTTLAWLRAQISVFDPESTDEEIKALRDLRTVYCSLHSISSMEEEYELCSKILASKKCSGPIVVLLKLPEKGWLYGHCNFKMGLTSEYDLKFVDRYQTVIGRDMEIFVRGLGHITIVFPQIDLFHQFKIDQIDARFSVTLVLDS